MTDFSTKIAETSSNWFDMFPVNENDGEFITVEEEEA